jgi:dTDP-4-dehydrorhamnose reductase
VLAARDFGAFSGTYHLAASGHTSWQGFAEAIVRAMPEEGKKCQVVEPIATSEYPLPARRPAYSVLSCEKLRRTFGLQLPAWQESLKQVLET